MGVKVHCSTIILGGGQNYIRAAKRFSPQGSPEGRNFKGSGRQATWIAGKVTNAVKNDFGDKNYTGGKS